MLNQKNRCGLFLLCGMTGFFGAAIEEPTLKLYVLPFGVEPTVHALTYWSGHPIIPSARIALLLETSEGAGLQSSYSVELTLQHESQPSLNMRATLEYSQSYSLNIGACGRVHVSVTLSHESKPVASSNVSFEIGAVDMSSFDGPPFNAIDNISPPVRAPEELKSAFTMNGAVKVSQLYFDDSSDQDKTYPRYSFAQISNLEER